MPFSARSAACRGLAVVAIALAALTAVRADDNPVVGVVAIDSYGDLKKQIAWIGEQVNYPQLAAMAESGIMMATQFKGLAGLDATRPIGIIVTANGDTPVVHGYVPVKNLDQLLDVFQGVVGPAQKDGDKRILMPPMTPPIEIIEKDGWAVVAIQSSPDGPANAEAIITKLAGELTLGVQLFPAAMPEGMREQVKARIEQLVEAAAAQGQPVNAAAVSSAFDGIAETESMTLGIALEPEKERLFIENRTVMVPGSEAANVWANAGKTENGLGLPASADGQSATFRAHHAQAVPPEASAAIEATLAQALPAGTGDPIKDTLSGLLQDIIGAMLDTGSLTGGVAVDTSGATRDLILPAVTLSAKIKDGPALEEQLKKRLGEPGALPPQATITFDSGKEGAANLHTLEIDLEGLPKAEKVGGKLSITIAVSADRVCVLAGGDAPTRVGAAMEAASRTDDAQKPLTGIDIWVPGAMQWMAVTADDEPAAQVLGDAAKEAAAKPAALVRLLVRPIEGGVATRLVADGGAIQAIAKAVTAAFALRPDGPVAAPGGDFDGL